MVIVLCIGEILVKCEDIFRIWVSSAINIISISPDGLMLHVTRFIPFSSRNETIEFGDSQMFFMVIRFRLSDKDI